MGKLDGSLIWPRSEESKRLSCTLGQSFFFTYSRSLFKGTESSAGKEGA